MILNKNDFHQIDHQTNSCQLQLQLAKAQFDKMLAKLNCNETGVATMQNLSGVAAWADNEQDRTADAIFVSIAGCDASNQLRSV